jgi:hypothetical protein
VPRDEADLSAQCSLIGDSEFFIQENMMTLSAAIFMTRKLDFEDPFILPKASKISRFIEKTSQASYWPPMSILSQFHAGEQIPQEP